MVRVAPLKGNNMNTRQENWQGMNWITQRKRLAIYLRDGCACKWCGAAVEDGVKLTLDHVKPHSKGGTNDESNLITACKRCNDSRGARSLKAFAAAVATYLNHGVQAEAILAEVKAAQRRSIKPHLVEAAALIERRGSALKALQERNAL